MWVTMDDWKMEEEGSADDCTIQWCKLVNVRSKINECNGLSMRVMWEKCKTSKKNIRALIGQKSN